MLGNAQFFREENQSLVNDSECVLLEIDGYGVAEYVFGEGSFTWTIDKDELEKKRLENASLVFEVGT